MNKLKKYIQDKAQLFKRLKKKIENKNETIQEQADTINYLIQEKNTYKTKTIELERKLKEERSKNKFLIERETKLQSIEEMFANKKVDLKELSTLVKGGKK